MPVLSHSHYTPHPTPYTFVKGILLSPEMSSDTLNWAPIPARLCNIPLTLGSGMSFRWRERQNGEWHGVIADSAVRIRPCADGFWWQTYPLDGRWDLIEQYFALDVDLPALYSEWIRGEPRIQQALERFEGLRVLRLGADEAFFSFICASCNTIVKITRTIQALEKRAGVLVAEIDGEPLHRFPTAGAIAGQPESELREELWGYRAPRLIELSRHVTAQGPGWLDSLSKIPYRKAHAELTALFGIGAKLADCICLFGLGHDDAVPVDTHIRRIATLLFRPDLEHKSLTANVYWTLGDLIREKLSPKPGWAQQYLFLEAITTRTPDRLNA